MQPLNRIFFLTLMGALALGNLHAMEQAGPIANATTAAATGTTEAVKNAVIIHADKVEIINGAAAKPTSEVTKAVTRTLSQALTEVKEVLSQHKVSTALGVATIAFIMYCIFRFNCKEPQKDCVNRYSLAFKDLSSRADILEQTRYIVKNIHYLIEDGLIGRPGNSSAAIRVDAETGKVTAKEKCPYQGLFGWIHAYSTPIVKTLEFPYKAGKVGLTTLAGIYVLANFDRIFGIMMNANYETYMTGQFQPTAK